MSPSEESRSRGYFSFKLFGTCVCVLMVFMVASCQYDPYTMVYARKVENFFGTWQLSKHQDSWWGLALRRDNWVCDGCLMILGNKLPHKLVLRYGDPDEGSGYEFNKNN